VAGSYEHGNGPLGSLKGWKFLDYLNDSQLLKNSVPLNWLCVKGLKCGESSED